MPQKKAECGTFTAYKRHKRNQEEPCEPCAEASREYVRAQRARQAERNAANAEAVSEADGPVVKQLVAYGEFTEVTVPEFEDALESARWRLKRIRAAMLVAGPRDVAPLAKAEADAVADIARLAKPAVEERKVSALDQLAERRAKRVPAA